MAVEGLTEAAVRIIQVKVVYLVSIWLEGFLYGIYLCLFIAAFPILIQNKALKHPSASVFFIGNVLIFVLVSVNSGLSLFHAVDAFAFQTGIAGPILAVYNHNYYIPILFAGLIFMIGDILMIYRCFLIWQRSYWAILLSAVLAATSSASHITVIWFALQVPFNLFLVQTWPPIALTIIFYLIQTTLTTSLIVWKIWSQSRQRTNTGLASVHVPCILSIMRIIVESAVIYTAGMFVMVVLLALDHPGRIVIHACMIPVTGIVFVLMALRIDAVRQESRHMPASASLMPTWLVDEPKTTSSCIKPEAQGDAPYCDHSERTTTTATWQAE